LIELANRKMAILTSLVDFSVPDLFLDISSQVSGLSTYLKLEGFNVAGSVKLKSARAMIDDAESKGILRRNGETIIESSSGNLGVALSMLARDRNYRFVCVTDPNITPTSEALMRQFEAEIVMVKERDERGGYLGKRLETVAALLQRIAGSVWLDQYSNRAILEAHANSTAEEILSAFPAIESLYVGSGTTGTLMGVAKRFREKSPRTEIVAVEPVGSITFDAKQRGARRIPGIGTSSPPALADRSLVDRVVYVAERDTVRACRDLVKMSGLFAGGSTGSVLAAMQSDSAARDCASVAVGLSPDFGHAYLNTVYSDEWVSANLGFE
jgi:N-(2-amino-2-carboxyethyl)-L-glutamate synthase